MKPKEIMDTDGLSLKNTVRFFLMENDYLIRGTHWHEDFAGFGNAIPDRS